MLGDLMNIGIICEYNPFHNGHLKHIQTIKNMYPDSNVILVMSGNFTQRGDLSIINKWDKTDIALNHNVNLVIELPTFYATQSADIFAKGAIDILTDLKVDKIVFGTESNNLDLLYELANCQINNKKYDLLVKSLVAKGLSYPKACQDALKKLTGKSINKPNDILGLCYIKRIIETNSLIEPIAIKRDDNFNDKSISKICSAFAIREALKQNKDISATVPEITKKYLNKHLFFFEDYYQLLKVQIINNIDHLTEYKSINQEISNRIKKYILESSDLETLINKVKTKNYPYNNIKRALLHILINLKNNQSENLYIRVLGFDKKGKNYLNKVKKQLTLPLISNYKNHSDLLQFDILTTSILSLTLPSNEQKLFIQNEYQHQPIFKK